MWKIIRQNVQQRRPDPQNARIYSVLSFLMSNKPTLFDENLVWLMDCDIDRRLHMEHGEPFYLNVINVVNRTWEGQFNNHIPWEKKMWEIRYGRQKYQNNLIK